MHECFKAWYLDDGTIVGDNLVVGKVLELIMKDGPRYGLHPNIDKTEVFWPKEDPRIRLKGVFSSNIARPSHDVKLLGGPASISKLYFSMCTCLPRVFESAQCSFDGALCSSLERIVTASGPGFGDWQWTLATLPFAFGGLVSIFQMALWKSQTEDHTFDWLRTVPIFDLGQTTKGKTYRCVLRHRLAGKEVDIELNGGRDKPLRPADMFTFDANGVDDFIPGRAVIDAA
ncbi:hypothetical protein Tco_1039679 [Tanacetum coccineum]